MSEAEGSTGKGPGENFQKAVLEGAEVGRVYRLCQILEELGWGRSGH